MQIVHLAGVMFVVVSVLICLLCLCAAPRAHSQVISEFLAQNNGLVLDEDGDSPDWIEIRNTADEPVNLANWALTDTRTNLTRWRFPETNLTAGAYLVVFASGKDRAVPGQRLHTNFQLSSGGEYLALVDATGSNNVSAFAPVYPPQFPNVSFGFRQLAGFSSVLSARALARVLIPADGALGTNWIAPDYDDASWIAGSNGVGYETTPAEYAPLIRTDVRASMVQNNSCYVRLPFLLENPVAFTQWRLLVQFDDGFIAYLNGREVARRNAPANAAWNSAATANHPDAEAVVPEEIDLMAVQDLFVKGTNVLALHGLNTSTTSSDALFIATIEARSLTNAIAAPAYFSTPTPGAPNVGGTEALGPLLSEVAHAPEEPSPGEPLIVRALVRSAIKPVGTVTLRYRVMFEAALEMPMFDDGAHQDGAANDGVFAATIPAGSAEPGQMIRYFVTALDTAGAQSRWPLYFDPLDSAQYAGAVVSDPSIESRLTVVHWFAQNPAQADTQTGTRGAVACLGELYDNVLFSLHGQSSSGFPKKGYNLDFTRDHQFRYATNRARVKDVKLLTDWADKSRVRNTLAYEMVHAAGSVGHFAFPVRVQRNGQFHAILDLMEDADERWMERVGRGPNGALYKMYNSLNSAGGNEKKTRKNEDFSDLQALVDNLSESRPLATRVAYAYDNLDLPQTISYFVALALISSQDHGHKNFFLYRDTEQSGEWTIFPWDVDLSWGRNWIDSGGYFTDTLYQNNVLNFYNASQQNKPSNRLYNLIFGHPDFRHMYLRRLRTVMDTVLQPAGTPPAERIIESRVRALLDLMDPPEAGTTDADLDYAKWGSWGNRNAMRAEAQRIIDLHLPGRRAFLFDNPAAALNGERIPPPQSPNAVLLFANLEFNPASGNQEEEYIQLLNSDTESIDLSGWTLSGGVQFTFKPGTVLPPNSSVYLSPNVAAFRARTTGPRGGQGLYVQGNYGGQLSARGESLRLTDLQGRLAAQTNYLGQPTVAQQFLRVTEVMYHPAPPPTGSLFTDEDFEFVELKNIGPGELALSGIRFTRGVSFSFSGSAVAHLAPGEHVLVVKNMAAFTTRYGTAARVAGAYLGSLDNAGETLRLEDAVGEVVSEFAYSPDWQPQTNGHGLSLELIDAATPPNSIDSWRAGTELNGTPGTDGPQPLAISRAAIRDGQFWITFPATPGKTYAVFHRAELVRGAWELLKTIPGPAAGEVQAAIPLQQNSGSHFYRIAPLP